MSFYTNVNKINIVTNFELQVFNHIYNKIKNELKEDQFV